MTTLYLQPLKTPSKKSQIVYSPDSVFFSSPQIAKKKQTNQKKTRVDSRLVGPDTR